MGQLVNQVLPQDIRKMEILTTKSEFKSLGYFQLRGLRLVVSRQCIVLCSIVHLHLLISYFNILLPMGMPTPLHIHTLICIHPCMYVCMHIYTYLCMSNMYIYVNTCIVTYTYMYVCMYMHICIYICMNVCNMCMHVDIYMSAYMHTYMHKHMHSYMHTCTYIHTQVCLLIYIPKCIHSYTIHRYIHQNHMLLALGPMASHDQKAMLHLILIILT